MDGERRQIYSGDDSPTAMTVLVRDVKAEADKLGIPFLDMQPVFKEDYARNGKRFNLVEDTHLNQYGHSVIADAILRHINEAGLRKAAAGT